MEPGKKRKRKQETQEQEESSDYKNNTQVKRRARIIVRNISFKSTEDGLFQYFKQFGPIQEVRLLKKPDGLLVGCAFIQFEVVQHAAKAIYHANQTKLLGRTIVCDWAQNKKSYVKNMREAMQAEKKIKEENEILEVKDEKGDDDVIVEIKKEDEIDMKEENEIKDKYSNQEESSDEDESSDEESEDDSISDVKEEPEIKKPRIISNDVQEGKTVFIKNVPFSATNSDVEKCMVQFGPVEYALVCLDKLTEHSKGTAFVKFRKPEDAEKCLQAGTELMLMGQTLDCHKAMSRDDVANKKNTKEVQKDSRNLYLIKEGVILAGSRAAQTVSPTDMAKRLELEKWKTQILRNLNMFISKYRLIIHNLPPTYDDKQLRQLFSEYSGPTAVIKEARVMKDLRKFDEQGKPISKGYGFVTFTQHEDALKTLRTLNNNPSIFTRAKRPIVAFSIENKAVMNARTKRLLKSKINNPACKEFDPKTAKKSGKAQQISKPQNKQTKLKIRSRNLENTENEYTGATAKPGQVNKLRTKYKLKQQAQIHKETVKEEKKKKKLTRKILNSKFQDKSKQRRQKKNKEPISEKRDNFSKMLNKYRKSSAKTSKTKKRKWYEASS